MLLAALTACGVAPHVAPLEPVPKAPLARPTRATVQLGCIGHPRIDVWERRLRERHGRTGIPTATAEREAEYLPRLQPLVAAGGLPRGLALLPVIESGFRPRARGRAGEGGLWQLRPATARRFGLIVTHQKDERFVPERATRAAVRYLAYLHARYRDWPLALAAYNAGEGRIDRALARRPRASFWELAHAGLVPRRSRQYVPRFLALVRLNEPGARDPPSTRVARRGE